MRRFIFSLLLVWTNCWRTSRVFVVITDIMTHTLHGCNMERGFIESINDQPASVIGSIKHIAFKIWDSNFRKVLICLMNIMQWKSYLIQRDLWITDAFSSYNFQCFTDVGWQFCMLPISTHLLMAISAILFYLYWIYITQIIYMYLAYVCSHSTSWQTVIFTSYLPALMFWFGMAFACNMWLTFCFPS